MITSYDFFLGGRGRKKRLIVFRTQESQTFTDLITPRERFDPNSWKFPAQGSKKGGVAAPASQPGDTFPRELAKRAWFLPPGFNPVQFGRLVSFP